MYGGKCVTLELKCKSEFMKAVVDKFREDVNTKVGGGWFKAVTEEYISPAFWLAFLFSG